MSFNPWGLPDPVVDGQTIHGDTWERLFRATPNQLQGALAAIGIGVLSGWAVTAGTGATVSVGAGAGIANHSTYGPVALATSATQAVSGFDEGDNWLFAAIDIAATLGAHDSRDDGVPKLAVQSNDTLNGAQVLAKVTNTGGTLTITDLRQFIGGAGLLGDMVPNGGRLVGADPTVLEPQETGSPSLNVVLPAGSIYDIGNQRVKLGADVNILAPASFDGYPFLSIDPDSGEPTVTAGHWYPIYPTGADLAALRAAGLPCLGRVATSLTAVTVIDPSASAGRADLIYTQAGLLALIVGGGAPDVSGLITQVAALTAQVADLQAEINLLTNSATQGAAPDLGGIYSRLAISETELAKTQVMLKKLLDLLAPTLAPSFRASIVEAVPGVTIVGGAGDRGNDSPDFRGAGNMTYDNSTGEFTP